MYNKKSLSSTILVTGGAGFIGSNFVLDRLKQSDGQIINLDKLTYAGNPSNLKSIENNPGHIFVHGDISDRGLIRELLQNYQPWAIINFAAESHVDRSIHGPDDFIQTNVVGTFHLLEEVRAFWQGLPESEQSKFRFLHVSTDEVYGSLEPDDPPFSELSPYSPNSPYSASKASSDHLVRAYHHTYGLPTLITNCSNNYGPYQFPEKLIPLMILNAVNNKPLPVYGDGKNVRDWLYVTDHCAAIRTVLAQGRPGEVYNIGGNYEKTNIEIVQTICSILDELHADQDGHGNKSSYLDLITFVTDRPGHDRRYAIDAGKIKRETGWVPKESFETGIRKTISWYLDNLEWVKNSTDGSYQNWITKNYGSRRKK